MEQNLESLIKSHAEMMAEQMVKAVEWAGSEEDIRHEVNKLIDEFIKKAGLTVKIRGQHEYTLGRGAIDSKYGGVIIEYKDPKGAGKIIENKNAPGVKAVVKQIKKRFKDFQTEEHINPERIFAVGCDGDTFVFVHYSGKTLEIEDPQQVTPHTVQRLLRAIVSLGARGLSFTPEKLAAHFGSESTSAREGVRLIHNLIHQTDSPKAQTFFRQWQILFGEVCGYDIHGQSAKVKKLAEHYRVPDPNPAELLFAVHTYYAIFMKMLAAEIVSSFNPIGASPLKRMIQAPTDAKLLDELKYLEHGGIWKDLKINNFLEGDLFSWYLDAWNEECAEAVRTMTQSLEQFDPTTLSIDPNESRDLLKQLYQQLFPKSVRHDLGEYYTPDWLADLTLNELGYDGDPDKRLLDPACGSGTFLVMAINRVKAWYDEHRHECGFGEDELLRKVLRNIIGFDLNPLAVMAARTNYLMSIRDLLRHADNVELPVYLCDSIMMPFVTGSLEAQTTFLASSEVAFDPEHPPVALPTAPRTFFIPHEVASNREAIGKYADTLEFCINNHYSPDEFIERCETEGIPATEAILHKDLYRHLQRLDADNQNGIWARIIKNAFAPLFIGTVDYIAGNPPWINWENLPETYRDGMKPLWQEYGLFTLSGSAARLGGGKKDLSMLFVYSAVDNYLEKGGKLGFVITQSVFKTQGAGDGFRQLQYKRTGSENTWHLRPLIVHDLSAFQPFEGATNRTAVAIMSKESRSFSYPVRYTVWKKTLRGKIASVLDLNQVRVATARTKLAAQPVRNQEKSSPWLTAPKQALPGIQKVIGQSDYRAYEGVNTGGLNGCFWLRILEKRPNGDLLIENMNNIGKIKVPHVEAVIEPDLVYPLLRGRDVQRWHAEPSAHIILAQDPQTRKGIPEPEMKRQWPKTYAYLKQFEGDSKSRERGTLWGRASSSVVKLMEKGAFYSMFAVGPYTVAKWKVVWRYIATEMTTSISDLGGHNILPDCKLMLVPCDSKLEAQYVSALLNSSPSNALVMCYVIGTQIAPHVLTNVAISQFNKADRHHTLLAELSQQCHTAAEKNNESKIAEMESEIDKVAAKIWGINNAELKAIQKALTDM